MNLLSLAHFTAFLICGGLIIFILAKNPKAVSNRVCALLIGCYGVWNFAFAFMQAADSLKSAKFWENIAVFGWGGYSCFSLWLVLSLTRQGAILKKWYFYPLLFFEPAFFVYKQWTGDLINNLIYQGHWWALVWSNSVWPWLFFAYYFLVVIIIIWLGAGFIKNTKLIQKKKTGTRLILVVTSATLILGTVTDVLLPQLKVNIIPPVASIILLGIVCAITFSITKYRIMTLTPTYAAADILATMGDSLILINAAGILIEANQATLNLLGFSREELVGQPVTKIFSDADSLFKNRESEQLFQAGALLKDYQIRYRTKNGVDIPVSFSGSLMFNEENIFIGIVGVARDLREIIRFQEKEREYMVEKARTEALQERAQELQDAYDKLKTTQAMLLQTEKMAAVGQLAGGVAHEINNPMGVIMGFAQSIVKRINASDPLFPPLKSIEREAIRCKKLVENLLIFSRTGKAQVELIDLNQTIDEPLSLIVAQAKVKNIEIIKTYDPDLPYIMVNKNQIQQVIVNLCNNAIDAMPNGGRIAINTKQTGPQITIEISDTGQGITEEVQKHIFEPFFTTKEIGKGTGLGLSICYEIIQNHHGVIEVESKAGLGATFRIKLPITERCDGLRYWT